MKFVIITKIKGIHDKVYGPYDSLTEAENNEAWLRTTLSHKYAVKVATIIRVLIDPKHEEI